MKKLFTLIAIGAVPASLESPFARIGMHAVQVGLSKEAGTAEKKRDTEGDGWQAGPHFVRNSRVPPAMMAS